MKKTLIAALLCVAHASMGQRLAPYANTKLNTIFQQSSVGLGINLVDKDGIKKGDIFSIIARLDINNPQKPENIEGNLGFLFRIQEKEIELVGEIFFSSLHKASGMSRPGAEVFLSGHSQRLWLSGEFTRNAANFEGALDRWELIQSFSGGIRKSWLRVGTTRQTVSSWNEDDLVQKTNWGITGEIQKDLGGAMLFVSTTIFANGSGAVTVRISP